MGPASQKGVPFLGVPGNSQNTRSAIPRSPTMKGIHDYRLWQRYIQRCVETTLDYKEGPTSPLLGVKKKNSETQRPFIGVNYFTPFITVGPVAHLVVYADPNFIPQVFVEMLLNISCTNHRIIWLPNHFP